MSNVNKRTALRQLAPDTVEARRRFQNRVDAIQLGQVAHCMDNFLREENQTLEFEVLRYQRLYREASADRDRYAQEVHLNYRNLEAMDDDIFRLEGVVMRQVAEISRLRAYLDFLGECLDTVARDELPASAGVVQRLRRLISLAQETSAHVSDADSETTTVTMIDLTASDEELSDDE